MIIKSFLPNPIGKDTEGEYVIVFNDSANSIHLSGWYIQDKAGKKYILSGSLNSKEELILSYSKTKIPLNNNGETVFLYDDEDSLIDSLLYIGQAEEGAIITQADADGGIYERSEIIESWPPLSGVVNNSSYLSQFFPTMIVLSVIFASLAVYGYQKLYRNEKAG